MRTASRQSSRSDVNQSKKSNNKARGKAHSLYDIEHHDSYDHVHFKTEVNFNKTASKILQTHYAHHEQSNCLCQQCICGRHLCKFQVKKPDLSKNTAYQRSFKHSKAIKNIEPHSHQYDKLKGPHLDLTSTYQNGFVGKQGDQIDRPHPKDVIKENGLMSNISSYSQQFPGHRGQNQYIKPTNSHSRGYFPLRSKSTYTSQFKPKQYKKDEDIFKPQDQLKSGMGWLGQSTYGRLYTEPNPEYLAKKVKIVEKREENPNYVYQYKTTYKSDFIKKITSVCPSKIQLQSKDKDKYSQIKNKFNENTDFKSISPNFHPTCTSYM